MGQSIMLSLQLALDEIKMITLKFILVTLDYNDQEKLIQSVNSLQDQNIKIVIGPINNLRF